MEMKGEREKDNWNNVWKLINGGKRRRIFKEIKE